MHTLSVYRLVAAVPRSFCLGSAAFSSAQSARSGEQLARQPHAAKVRAMESYILDWAGLLLRWLHVITAIAWIGSSFYFVFLRNTK